MAINYFSQLGFDRLGQNTLGTAQGIQGLRANAQAMDINQQNVERQRKLDEQAALKFQNEQQRARAAQGAGAFYNALNSGNTNAALQIAEQYQDDINSLGDPTFTVETVKQMMQTPEGVEQLKQMALGTTQLAAGPEQMAQFASRQAGFGGTQAIPADIAKYEYWKKMNPNATEAEQREKLNELLVPSERALAVALASGMGKRQTEQEMIPVEAGKAAAIETAKAGAIAETPLGQAEIEAKQMQAEDARLKAEAAKRERAEKIARSRDMANEALVTVNELLSHPSFSKVVGTVDTLFTVRPDSQDAINLAKRLQSLLTVDNLKLMSGVLTDKDIAFLTGVASGLNVTDDGIKGSESGVKNRLNSIRKKLENNLSKAQDKIDDTQSQATAVSNDVVDWSQL